MFYKDMGQSNLFGMLPPHYGEEVKARMGYYNTPDELMSAEDKEMAKYVRHCQELQQAAQKKAAAEQNRKFYNWLETGKWQ